jgi:hypothetical protein
MLTVVIKHDGEENVTKLTYNNLWKEIKNIPDAELLVELDWFDAIPKAKNDYICFVESDCLVTSGYFASQLGLMKKNKHFRKMAVMSSSTSVKNWANKLYGYSIGDNYADGIVPNKNKSSNQPYPVEIAYIPGSIIRIGMLKKLIDIEKPIKTIQKDLSYLSTLLSIGFWSQGQGNGIGNMVYINPNAGYCTTEEYVNDIAHVPVEIPENIIKMFKSQVI